jgi:hypothetical protein
MYTNKESNINSPKELKTDVFERVKTMIAKS